MVDYKRIPWPDVVVLAGTQTVTAYSYTCCSILMWVYRNVYEVIILEGILMKCEECKFCKYDNSIKEWFLYNKRADFTLPDEPYYKALRFLI